MSHHWSFLLHNVILDYCDFQTLWNNREFFGDSYLQKRASTTAFSIVVFCNYERGKYDYPEVQCHIVLDQSRPSETSPNDIYDIKTIDSLYDIPHFDRRLIWGANGSSLLWPILNIPSENRYLWIEYEHVDIQLMHSLYADDPTVKIPEYMYTPVLLGMGTDSDSWFQVGDLNKCGCFCGAKWGTESEDAELRYLDVPTLPDYFQVSEIRKSPEDVVEVS
jgi:hypothetical protein